MSAAKFKLGDNCIQKFLFGEVFCWIYSQKFSFMVTWSGAVKIISDPISDDIPPQI